jgi:hypothetical protein
MTAATSGITANLNPSVRSRNLDAGIAFTGYISVPTSGSYTFALNSDSGANLWVHDSHVIDNDANYAALKTSNPVYLAAGLHPIRLYYRHQGGNATLALSYSGPGITMQPVPASALFADGPTPVIQLRADALVTRRNNAALVDALANDTGNYPLTLSSVGALQSGTATISSGKILYTPNNGYLGSETFSYGVTGGAITTLSTLRADVLYDNEIWIPFDEGAGTSVRTVCTTTTPAGTLAGAANPANSWTPGRSGHAMSFDGDDDQINFPQLDLPVGASPRTFACWMRTATQSAGELQTLFSYGATGTGQRFSVRLNNSSNVASNQAIRLEVEGGRIIGTKIINDGQWHHIACVLADQNNDGVLNVDETQLYVDGVLDAVSSAVPATVFTVNSAIPCLAGSNHATNYNFKGEIGDVRIFPRALSSFEIGELTGTNTNLLADTLDSDGDGVPDAMELIAGTDPYNANSVFKISATALSGGNFTLHWPAVQGKTYTIQESPDLANWIQVPGTVPFVATAANPDTTVNIQSNASSKRFFRISVR